MTSQQKGKGKQVKKGRELTVTKNKFEEKRRVKKTRWCEGEKKKGEQRRVKRRLKGGERNRR